MLQKIFNYFFSSVINLSYYFPLLREPSAYVYAYIHNNAKQGSYIFMSIIVP